MLEAHNHEEHMNTVTLYAKLPKWAGIKAHEMRAIDPKRLANALMYTSESKCYVADTLCVGTAEVTVHLYPADQFAETAVKNLREQQSAIRAAAEVAANDIERQIQQLLAITFEDHQ
jgi:hypothetical protein